MNLVTAKSLDQIKLNGIKLSWEKHDGGVRKVTLTDGDGNFAAFKVANTYSDTLAILIPEPPKMEDRWLLSGTFAGCHIKRFFESERDANCCKEDFPADSDLTVAKVQVEIDGDGKAKSEDADIPF